MVSIFFYLYFVTDLVVSFYPGNILTHSVLEITIVNKYTEDFLERNEMLDTLKKNELTKKTG